MPQIRSSLDGAVLRLKACTEDLDDIRRALHLFSNDPIYRGDGNRVPLRQLAKLCGVSRKTLYDIMAGDRPRLVITTAERIRAAIELVLKGGLRWRRRRNGPTVVRYRVIKRIKIGRAVWYPVMPNGEEPPALPRPEPRKQKHDHPKLRLLKSPLPSRV